MKIKKKEKKKVLFCHLKTEKQWLKYLVAFAAWPTWLACFFAIDVMPR